jgi:hypothetical protein
MERKSDEEICLFVRDEQTGRFVFNAKALRALGINPVESSTWLPDEGAICFGRSSGRPYCRLEAVFCRPDPAKFNSRSARKTLL